MNLTLISLEQFYIQTEKKKREEIAFSSKTETPEGRNFSEREKREKEETKPEVGWKLCACYLAQQTLTITFTDNQTNYIVSLFV